MGQKSYVAFLGGFATFQKIDTDRNVVTHQYPDIIAEVSFEVVLHNGRAGGQTGKVLFTAKPFVSTIFHKRTKFVRAPKLLTDKTSRYPAMHS